MTVSYCRRCGRELKTWEAVRRGYCGPCWYDRGGMPSASSRCLLAVVPFMSRCAIKKARPK